MYINLHTLLHLPVYTQSGTHLGKVHDVKLDVESHSVKQYIVRGGFLSKGEYLIGPAQVIAITEEKMIVKDNVAKDTTGKTVPVKDTTPKRVLGGVMPSAKEQS